MLNPLNKRLADGLLLTGTAAVATNTLEVNGRDQHTLYVTYSPDTDSTNALEVSIEVSPDGTNWHPYTGAYSDSTGTITPGAAVTLSFGSDGTTDQNEAPYFFNAAAKEIRVKVSETNTPADFGNVTIDLISGFS